MHGLYILILKLLDFFRIFYARFVRTIKFLKILLKHIFVKLILFSIDNEFQSIKDVKLRSRVRIPAEADILDSMNDFVLIVFFGFAIKNYIDSEIPRS